MTDRDIPTGTHEPAEQAGYAVEVTGLSVDYADTRALDDVTLTIPGGAITGLLGRNGSGKTTLLSVLASLRRPTAGEIRVDGRDPWEDEHLMERTCLIRESGDLMTDEKVSTNLEFVATTRPTWDDDFAGRLLDAFELGPRTTLGKLSRGQQSAFGVVVGLASRAPLTMLDEVHLGMDAPSRYTFYEVLLEDYAAHPRTIILSSHLISEVERLLEHVIVLDKGRPVLTGDADELRAQHPGGLQELVVELGRRKP